MKLAIKLTNLIRKAIVYGPTGILSFIKNTRKRRSIQKWFLANARNNSIKPIPGITLVGQLTSNISSGKTLRDFAFALKKANIPFQALDIDDLNQIPKEDCMGILTPKSDFIATKYNHLIEIRDVKVPELPGVRHGRILFWEYESGIIQYDASVLDGQDIIAMSDFNASYYRKALPTHINVQKILYPLQLSISHSESIESTRDRYGIPQKAFAVFYNFGLGSDRKNPYGSIDAFAKACKNDDSVLVFKIAYSKQFPSEKNAIVNYAIDKGIAKRLLIIDDYLSNAEIMNLTHACDVYMSLHRGEGFGLGMAEAMILGVPVIATNYSANTEFCNDKNSVLIPYTMKPMVRSESEKCCYVGVENWAEPDVDVAAKAIVRLKSDATLRATLSANAMRDIQDHFSTERFLASINEYIGHD